MWVYICSESQPTGQAEVSSCERSESLGAVGGQTGGSSCEPTVKLM